MAKTSLAAIQDSAKQPSRVWITLYKVMLTQGTIYYLAQHDSDVTANDTTASGTPSQTWQAFAHARSEAKSNADMQIDTLDVTIPNARIPFAGSFMMVTQLAIAGIFEKATVHVLKWNKSSPGENPFWFWSGQVLTANITRRDVSLRLESLLSIALRQIPRTFFDEKCNNQVFDTWCALKAATYQQSLSVLASSTQGLVICSPNNNAVFTGQSPTPGANGYWDLGQITMTSGLNNGVVRSIKQSLVVAGNMQLTLLQPLPFQPNVGDTFNALPGCDLSIGTCINKFNNLNGQVVVPNTPAQGGYRGFPRIPKPTDTL